MTATTDKSEPVGQGRGEDMQTRLGRLLDEVEAMPAGQPDAAQEQTEAEQGAPAAGNPLGGLLSNPELTAALPQLMGALGPRCGTSARRAAGMPVRLPGNRRPTAIRRCSVRSSPYLSPERRQAAETALELLGIQDALAGMGLSLPSLAGSRPAGEVRRDVQPHSPPTAPVSGRAQLPSARHAAAQLQR